MSNSTIPDGGDYINPETARLEKYIGLSLALSSSFLIGTSFILTKRGLMEVARNNGGKSADTFAYLKSTLWWTGMVTMILGEAANFAAYSFAPAILVTPLGAGSVLISAILASIFLNEQLTKDGIIGCCLCFIGSLVIILHSPEEYALNSKEEVLKHALKPGFLVYLFLVTAISVYLIYFVGPLYGKKYMLVYITICSLVGSISVMAAKGLGVALKLTFSGDNQFGHASTYIFAFTVIFCAVTQINYFNKALDLFSTNRVTPVYYVMFTTATIVASVILFNGVKRATAVEITTIICGFVTIFIGVFMVNAAKPTQPSMPGQGSKPGSRGSLNILSQEIALKPLVQTSLLRSLDPNQREFNLSDGEEEDEQRLVFSSSPV